MKTLAVHQNLDTSFVNLSALLRHLREREFAGQVLVKLSGYKAEVTFDADGELKVFEHDKVAGRIAEGDEALQRLLIRAREPGGTIDVFQFVPEFAAPPVFRENRIEKPNNAKELFSFALPKNGYGTNGNGKKDKKESRDIFETSPAHDFLNLIPKNHSPLPLEFTNRVEDRARRSPLSEEEWQTFLRLIGELLGGVDEVLARANLNFTEAFTRVCAEISGDYPFMNFASGAFVYHNGAVELNARPSAKLCAAAINEALRRILDDLAAETEFAEIYRDAAHRILASIHNNKSAYAKFFITPQLERIIGV